MFKVVFTIDDYEYFRRQLKDKLSESDLDELLSKSNAFKGIYTLIQRDEDFENCYPSSFTLTDFENNKININNLNGYQKGVVLGDCQKYFRCCVLSKPYENEQCEYPVGVINIEVEKD